jgi:hypothetical protein
MMKKPRFTRLLEQLLNPVLGKSLVVYCKKPLGAVYREACNPAMAGPPAVGRGCDQF